MIAEWIMSFTIGVGYIFVHNWIGRQYGDIVNGILIMTYITLAVHHVLGMIGVI